MLEHLYGYTLVGPLKLVTTMQHVQAVDRILVVLENYSPETWGDEDNEYRHLSWSEDDADMYAVFLNVELTGANIINTLVQAWDNEAGSMTLSRQLSDTERVVSFGALLFKHGGCDESLEFRIAQLFEKFEFFEELGIRVLSYIDTPDV